MCEEELRGGKTRPPEAVAAHRPVARVLEPVVEASWLQKEGGEP